MHMTVRITVSLPDDVHAGLVRIAEGSHISASAVVRTVLSDAVPRLTSVLEFLGTVKAHEVPQITADLDAWARNFKALSEGKPIDGRTIVPAAGKQPQRDVFAYFVSTDKPNAPINALGIQQRLNITAASG